MTTLDHWAAACIVPLAVWILLSGLDDLLLDLAALLTWLRRGLDRGGPPPDYREEKAVAIFLPLWHEDGVAETMIRHTIAAVHYRRYTVFAGCYRNDAPTVAALHQAAGCFPNVQIAMCPHDGPTSKADCLNWIYERMLEYEATARVRFDVILIHDAEDVIHPDSLRFLSRYSGPYDMVQIPVLPLATGIGDWTHGTYCDEFAEFHGKDLVVRQRLGGFVPSAGVGTAYSRRAIEFLAAQGGPFDPDSLTEDYATGLRLSRAGCRQRFVALRLEGGTLFATREYFPRTMRQAVRQRTRWIAGIALQGWERYGWGRNAAESYWLWRDRKGLVGNPVSLFSNLLFAYGAATGLWSHLAGIPWGLAEATPPVADALLRGTLALLVFRSGVRAGFSARIYGWKFAAVVPLRAVWANWINGAATLSALVQYSTARIRRRRLEWCKTEHTYPEVAELLPQRRRLGEILASMQFVSADEVHSALAHKDGLRLGEHLVRQGRLSEEDLYAALSVQRGVPFERLDLTSVPEWVSSLLPEEAIDQWNVVPCRVGFGILFVAGPELPSPGMEDELGRLTGMQVRFQLVTPADYARTRERRAAAAGA